MVKWAITTTILLLIVGAVLILVNKKPTVRSGTGGYFGNKVTEFCFGPSCIKNKDGKWVVNDIPAAEEMVQTYLQKLSEFYIGEIVSNNRENFEEFGISQPPIKIQANGKELEIGNINNSYNATFVHIPGTEYINIVETVMDRSHLADPKTWEIRMITNIPLPDVQKIVRSEKGKETEIKTTDVTFRQTLASLVPVNYLKDFKPVGTKEISFRIETKDGMFELHIGKDKFAYATTDHKDYFEISSKDWGVLTRIYK